MTHIPEHILDPLEISPDQFLDCVQAIIHTILFHRSIDTQVSPKSILLPGVDICYASGETEQVTEYIKTRLLPMQQEVFSGRYEKEGTAWLILTLSYSIPRKGWFRDTYTTEIWERWCITFTFSALTASEIREHLLHKILQIKDKASESEVPRNPTIGSTFKFTLNLPTDKDWDTSTEFVQLVKKLCNTPSTIFP
ncbi:hypothetical protein GPJ56_010286 [Histomonas meleagridis]|nr:hypothetical protein GPJ56_010286 [Histomonas meleagridis]